jgi:beta-lactamase regulating signal transducer with metallopeptidase domain
MDATLNAVMALTLCWAGASELLQDVAIKSLVLLMAASVLVLLLRNASAATRHLVWCVTVCGLLVLPVVSLIAPKWTVPVLPALPGDGLAVEGEPRVVVGVGEAGVEGVERGPARAGVVEPHLAAPREQEHRGKAPVAEGRASGIASANSGGVRAAAPPPMVPAAPETIEWAASVLATMERGANWRLLLPAIWLAGAFVLLTWMLGGLLRVWLLVRSAREVTHGPLAWLFDDLSEELDLAVRVTLLQTRGTTMPMVWGIRPRVLLPADADDWTDARLRSVLLHELAHVRRRDYLTQLVARFVATLYWFNPLVWVAIHRMRVERELACDDQVLCTGSRASDYASHLLEIARAANRRAFAPFGGVAMARRSRLSDRLLAVLDDTRRRATVTPRMAVAAWVGAVCFLLPIAGAGVGTVAETADPMVTENTVPVVAESTDPAPPVMDVRAGFATAVSTAPRAVVPIPSDVSIPSRQLALVTDLPLLAAFAIGSDQSRCNWYEQGANTSHWMSGEDGDYQVRITMDDCRLEVEIAGDIVFNDEETDIADISRRGYFEMEEREGRSRRRIVIEPTSAGDLERSWFVDGDERQYDSEASSWLRGMIPLLFRRVGLHAEERAGRILDREGVDGVLQEISQIPSDHIARKYYQVLLTDGDLDATQLRSIVRQAGDELESDYELAQLLVEVAENHAVDESVMVVYVEAAGSLESDYEQRRVLDTILSRQELSPDVAEAMLRLATELESDYELAELLIAILQRHPIDEALTREFFDAVHTLASDYEHNRVLKVALHEGAPDMEVLDLALESAANIDSDYERAELLLEVAELYPVGETMPPAYLTAARSLDSDYELGRVLKFLIDHQRLNEDALEVVLDASLTLDSDYELAGLLLEIVERYELSDRERETYFSAVGSIESDYELGRVLKAIVETGPLTEQNLSDVLTTSRELESEYELANLLIVVADNHSLDGDLRTMFMRAADNISSEYERGRVLSALSPRGGRPN